MGGGRGGQPNNRGADLNRNFTNSWNSTGGQGSSRLLSLRGANGLLLVPPGEETYPVGCELDALLTGPIHS